MLMTPNMWLVVGLASAYECVMLAAALRLLYDATRREFEDAGTEAWLWLVLEAVALAAAVVVTVRVRRAKRGTQLADNAIKLAQIVGWLAVWSLTGAILTIADVVTIVQLRVILGVQATVLPLVIFAALFVYDISEIKDE